MPPSDEHALRAQVRRDVRAFALGAGLATVAAAVAVLWQSHVIGSSTAAPIAGGAGAVAVVVSLGAWSRGDRRIRERLFVAAPAFLAAPALVAGVTHYSNKLVGFVVSFALALAAAAAFGYTGVIRRRRRAR